MEVIFVCSARFFIGRRHDAERLVQVPAVTGHRDANTPLVAADVRAAREAIGRHVVRTPLERSGLVSRRAGGDVWLKQENRQHTGSFKPRGALNKILSLSEVERRAGVVAASAGNHALGVAYACRIVGVECADIFVQRNAAPAKIAKLREYPVRVHLVGDTFEEAQGAALAVAAESGASWVSAYDDPAVIAGQGTVGLEIVEDLDGFDLVVVPVGGGALVSGIALVVKEADPGVRVVGVNVAASPSALLSFREGRALDPYDHEPTLAHGLAGGFGRIPFAVARHVVDEIVLVTEDEIKTAMAVLIDSDQVLAEASGAAAVAALLAGKVGPFQKAVVVISGGNVEAATLRDVLRDAESPVLDPDDLTG